MNQRYDIRLCPIFLIEDGKVKESGTHQKLIKLGGRYAKLYDLQAEGYRL